HGEDGHGAVVVGAPGCAGDGDGVANLQVVGQSRGDRGGGGVVRSGHGGGNGGAAAREGGDGGAACPEPASTRPAAFQRDAREGGVGERGGVPPYGDCSEAVVAGATHAGDEDLLTVGQPVCRHRLERGDAAGGGEA